MTVELFKGNTDALKARLQTLLTGGATNLTWGCTSSRGEYIIIYTP